jgi:hypothetical protein
MQTARFCMHIALLNLLPPTHPPAHELQLAEVQGMQLAHLLHAPDGVVNQGALHSRQSSASVLFCPWLYSRRFQE